MEPATCEICGDELEKAWPYDVCDACCDAAMFRARTSSAPRQVRGRSPDQGEPAAGVAVRARFPRSGSAVGRKV